MKVAAGSKSGLQPLQNAPEVWKILDDAGGCHGSGRTTCPVQIEMSTAHVIRGEIKSHPFLPAAIPNICSWPASRIIMNMNVTMNSWSGWDPSA